MRDQTPTALAATSGFQFVHLEAYARRAGMGKAGGHDLASIVAEAERAPNACPHVAAPKPPVIHYGCTPAEVARRATEWAESAKDSQGRKLRIDGLCLVAGVISFPRQREDDWPAYRTDLITWLVGQYGDRLVSVIEHIDEEHPHIHFYAVPLPGERFESIHPGRKAASEAKSKGSKKGEQNSAYLAAMREWQNEFHDAVASRHGLTRLGPGRRRLSRDEWRREQAAQRALASAQFKNGNFVPATPLPARQVDHKKIKELAFQQVDPRRSLLGSETYTREMVERIVDYASSAAERSAREDEQRRLQPIAEQSKFAAGATAAISSIQVALADTKVVLEETENARDEWCRAAGEYRSELENTYKLMSKEELTILLKRSEARLKNSARNVPEDSRPSASDASTPEP